MANRRYGSYPTELQEQIKLAKILDIMVGNLGWLHVPNEGKRSVIAARMTQLSGMKRGAPDVLIFKQPPSHPFARGVAIELKRVKGGVVSPEQKQWLEALRGAGWVTAVCPGADDAYAFLKTLGY